VTDGANKRPGADAGWPRLFACLRARPCAAQVVLAINASRFCSAGEHGLPPQDTILNFGKVDDHLYRGAQLDSEGIKALKKLGVKLIVNLRQPWDGWKD